MKIYSAVIFVLTAVIVVAISGCVGQGSSLQGNNADNYVNIDKDSNTNTGSSDLSITPIINGQCAVGDECNEQVAQATGGQSPYIFSADPGTIVPAGLSIGTNGRLSGKPLTTGRQDFGICVKDAAGASKCATTSIYVIPMQPRAVIDSFTCTYVYTNNNSIKYYSLSASGSARGLTGTSIQFAFDPPYTIGKTSDCLECDASCDWVLGDYQTCRRDVGENEDMQWSIFVPSSEVFDGIMLTSNSHEVKLHARISTNDSLVSEDSKTAVCPQ